MCGVWYDLGKLNERRKSTATKFKDHPQNQSWAESGEKREVSLAGLTSACHTNSGMIQSLHLSHMKSKVPDYKPHQELVPVLHEPCRGVLTHQHRRDEGNDLSLGAGKEGNFAKPITTFMIHCWLPHIYLHQIRKCHQMQ